MGDGGDASAIDCVCNIPGICAVDRVGHSLPEGGKVHIARNDPARSTFCRNALGVLEFGNYFRRIYIQSTNPENLFIRAAQPIVKPLYDIFNGDVCS